MLRFEMLDLTACTRMVCCGSLCSTVVTRLRMLHFVRQQKGRKLDAVVVTYATCFGETREEYR